MDFHDTVMGHQFYQSTMPSIAKSLKVIADNIEKTAADKKAVASGTFCAVMCTGPLGDTVEPVSVGALGCYKSLFQDFETAREVMRSEVIRFFNSVGWTETSAESFDDIRKSGFTVDDNLDCIRLFSGASFPGRPADFVWQIVELNS